MKGRVEEPLSFFLDIDNRFVKDICLKLIKLKLFWNVMSQDRNYELICMHQKDLKKPFLKNTFGEG